MPHHPHDLISRDFLSNLEVAKSFLKAYLKPHIQARCNFDTLRLEPTSYIEPDLRQHYMDVLYAIEMDGEETFIFILIEPQHKPLKLMPLRLLRYVLSPLKEYAEKHGDNAKLPVIIPILLYSGSQTPYPFSLDIFESFTDPDLARETLLNPKLIDLSIIPDEELKTHGHAAFLELVLKHVRDRDILNLAHDLVHLLKNHPLTGQLFKHMLQYLIGTGESESYDEFLKVIIDHSATEYKETTMTIAEQLENRGFQKGIHAGIVQGKLEGEHEAKITVAKNMLKNGFSHEVVKKITGLCDEDLAKRVESH